MKNNSKKSIFFAVVACVLIVQIVVAIPVQALGIPDVSTGMASAIINEITTTITPGLTQKEFTYVDKDSNREACFSLELNTTGSNVTIAAGTPHDSSNIGLTTVREQANSAIANGRNVVAAINADMYDMATGEPLGVVVKNGDEIHAYNNKSWKFFGVKKDGTPIYGDRTVYENNKGNVKQALGIHSILVDHSEIVNPDKGDTLAPRLAVGVRADKSIFFLLIDGRQDPYSHGLTLEQTAHLMRDMGAVWAGNLDGGGSATIMSRTPGDSELTLKNKPSDGVERSVANSWLILSDNKSDGQFASAYITPADKTYTPNSTVQMVAKGLDSSGAAAELPPSGLAWVLSDPSFGTIDEHGLVTSTGKEGQVQVQFEYNGKVVGSTYIEFVKPDKIFFKTPDISLPFDTESDLGFCAQYQYRDIILKEGDIKWEIPTGMGTMSNSILHTSSDGSVKGNIVARAGDLTATIKAQVGQLPVVIYNFENGIGDWSAANAGRGEVTSVDTVDYSSGEPVRFDNKSLKLNFDFTNGQKGTTLGAYAGPAKSVDIPGSPSAIGAWVYGTPQSQGYWLRCAVYDANGTAKVLNFTDQFTGINWLGWKYCEAPLGTLVGPFKTFPKQMIRLMSLKSGLVGGGALNKGHIYVDNVRAVYGTNVDDLYAPIIDPIGVDGKTYQDGNVNITVAIHDDSTDKYMSGINWDRIKISVDGKDYTNAQGHYSYDKDGTFSLSGYCWPDGVHKVTVNIQDNFGNETTKDAYFTVNSGSGTKVELKSDSNTAPLGGNYFLHLNTNNVSDIQGVTAQIKLAKGFSVSNVQFDPSVAVGSSYDYDDSTGIITVTTGTPSGTAGGENVNLATVVVSVPKNTKSGSKLEYSVVTSSIQYKSSKKDNYCPTFSTLPASVTIISTYQIRTQDAIVGKDGKVLVTDQTGIPVAGAAVTMKKDDGSSIELGTTGMDGILTSSVLTASLQKFTLTAEKEGQYSFELSARSYTPVKDVIPSNLMSGTTNDPKTQKSITWMSNPLTGGADSIMQYKPKSEYDAKKESDFKDAVGISTILYYDTDGVAVRQNSVVANGLKPNTAYSYRVGDGTNWSAVNNFTTMADTGKFTFNVFGDTQSASASGLEDFSKIFTTIESLPEQPEFSIHVGDFVDDEQIFNQIDFTTAMFNEHPKFNSIDMIHIFGNHEYQGDDGTKASTIYGVPRNGPAVNSKGCYSTDYGNMHISVLGWTDNKNSMKSELEWLRNDINASNKTWKIVATHQPVYNKNPDDTGSAMFHDMLAPVCDELGIDIVFNGHDHSYGRTFSLVNGKKANNGTVYIAAGHTAEKTYPIQPADSSVFDYIQANEDDRVYITCKVDGRSLTIEAKTSEGTVIDTYTAFAKLRTNKSTLLVRINDAITLHDNAVEGNEPGQYAAGSKAKLKAAIDSAQAVYDDAAATSEAVETAKTAIEAAVASFNEKIVGPLQFDELDKAIDFANTLLTAAQAGVKPGQYPQAAIDAFSKAKDKAISDKAACKTQASVNAVLAELKVAKGKFDNAMVIPPNPDPKPEVNTNSSEPAPTFISDTTADFNVNGIYQFKISSVNGQVPTFEIGTAGVFSTQLTKTVGNDYYFTITAIGTPGTKAGIYVNGVKLLVVTVDSAASSVKVDTTLPFNVKAGAAYTFMLTSESKPTFTAGTSSAFKVDFVKAVGKNYFFKVTAVDKAGKGSGFYVNSQKTPVVVATIS